MLKKGDHVVFKCSSPATGWVKRVAKDGSWADVLWDAGINCRYVARHKTKNMINLSKVLNRLATDPLARAFMGVE